MEEINQYAEYDSEELKKELEKYNVYSVVEDENIKMDMEE